MRRDAGARAFAATVILTGMAGAARAQSDPAREVIDEAAPLCAAAVLRPETLPNVTMARGYAFQNRAKVSAISNAVAYGKGTRTLTITTNIFPDAESVICTFVTNAVFTVSDIEALKTRLEADPGIGQLDGAVGAPDSGAAKLVFGHFKKPGSNPAIFVSMIASPQLLNIHVGRTEFTKKN